MSEAFSASIKPQVAALAEGLKNNMHLGMQLTAMRGGYAEITLPLKPEHVNEERVMDTGVMMIVLDSCMGLAARSLVDAVTSGATVEMKTSFYQPICQAGQSVKAKAKVVFKDEMLYHCEADLWLGTEIIAKAVGTFKVFLREELINRLKAKEFAYLKPES